ncbi:MAG: LysR family transcriptional regulator [Pseudomonadota bacterium]
MVRLDAVTLKQLRALAAIDAHGSVTAAAGALNVTPPAVSSQLRALEANLEAELVRRGPDAPAALTPAGREMLAAVQHIEATLLTAQERVQAAAAGRTGRVAFGVVSTGKYFAPGLIRQLRDAHPELEVALRIGNRGSIVSALERREIDLALMGRPPAAPPVESDFLGPHPHVIVAPPDHPLAGRRGPVPAEALLRETFLMREEGSGTRIIMTRFLDRIGRGRPWRGQDMGTNETIKQAVIAGLGIAFISAHTVTVELGDGRLKILDVEGLPMVRDWMLIRRADAELSPAAERFRQLVLAQQGRFLPEVAGRGPAAAAAE